MKSPIYYPLKFESMLAVENDTDDFNDTEFSEELMVTTAPIQSWGSIASFKTSKVANGVLRGNSIFDLMRSYPVELLGTPLSKLYGSFFPIDICTLQATQSVTNGFALKNNRSKSNQMYVSEGTEILYVVTSNARSKIFCGFQENHTEKYLNLKNDKGALSDLLNPTVLTNGDVFLVNPGTVYAIGTGVEILKIQHLSATENSVNTNALELHTTEERIAHHLKNGTLDFSGKLNKSKLSKYKFNAVNKVFTEPFFTVNKLLLDECLFRNLKEIHSFVLYICTEGSAIITVATYEKLIKKGETILIPSIVKEVHIISTDVELFEVYI